jgi:hypothetical protein
MADRNLHLKSLCQFWQIRFEHLLYPNLVKYIEEKLVTKVLVLLETFPLKYAGFEHILREGLLYDHILTDLLQKLFQMTLLI